MKKMFSLALALIMALALCVPAMAADVTITSNNNDDATYKAYQILNLTTVLNCRTEESDDEDGHTHGEGCYGYAYTVNAKYADAIAKFIEGNAGAKAVYDAAVAATPTKTEDQAIVEALNATTGRAIADALYIEVKGMDADATLNQGTAKDLSQGYWLIVDDSTLTDEEGKTISKSLVMLDTAGQEDITIVAKDDSMTLDKDVNDEEEKDTVDVGDTVTFTITSGAIPTKIAEYDTYTFIINDTMSKGLEYVANSMVVKVGETTLTSGTDYTPVISAYNAETGTTIKIDLGAYILAKDPADQVVTVEYKAVLNKDAVMGSAGNKNEATLTFTNNPDENQNGTTVPTEVEVYAAKITIDKYDGAVADKSVKLAGAQFKLYKTDGTTKLYYSVDADTKDVSWDATAATIVTTDENGDAEFSGLKAGTYYLEEVVAPTGYNLLADPVEVVIAESGDNAYANQEAAVANNTGTELPSTGGIGTTIFYTVGGVLMAAAVVLFVTKKKLSVQE